MGAVANLHLFYSAFQSFAVSKLISDHVCLICVQDCHQKENDQTPQCCNHSDCFDRLLFFRDVTSHLLCVHPLKWESMCTDYFCHSEVTWFVDPASSTEQIDGLVSSSPEFNPASYSSCKKFCFCASIYPLHILRIHYIWWWRSCVTPPQQMLSGRRKGVTNVV